MTLTRQACILVPSTALALLALAGATWAAQAGQSAPPPPAAAGTVAPAQASSAAPGAAGPAAGARAAAPQADLLERFLKIRAPGIPTIAPDGTAFFRDWPDGVFQLYRANAADLPIRPGSPALRLTNFPDGVAGFTLSEDGTRLIVSAAPGGNENTQFYLIDHRSPTPSPAPIALTSKPRVQHSFSFWLPSRAGFVFRANADSPSDFHIYKFEFTKDAQGQTPPGRISTILARKGSWGAADITRDEQRLLVGEYRSASDSSLFELNVASGELTDLTPKVESGTVAVEVAGYMPGEQAVLYLADTINGIPHLFMRDLATGSVTQPLPELAGKELDSASVSRDRTLLAVSINLDGYSEARLYRLPTFQPVPLPAMPKGLSSLVSMRTPPEGAKERTIVISSNAPRTPGLGFSFQIPTAAPAAAATPPAPSTSPALTPLTLADTQGIDLSTLSEPQLIRYKAFDGLEIPAFLFLPPGAKPGTPVPFVVNYHGGPEAQFRPGFDRTTHFLLSQGFGVLQPNVRGSTGYGRAFHMMDDYKKRWDSVRDGVDAAAWLVQQGYATPGKIATYGGSYGGFMSVATLVEDSRRTAAGTQKTNLFGAGINVVGIVNFKTFLEKTADYRRALREAEYGPLSDPEFLKDVSPLNHIDQINVPMMIGHGLNDPRVPIAEAIQLAVALKRKGQPPVEMYFHDEGHGFNKLDNRLLFHREMIRFLNGTIAKK